MIQVIDNNVYEMFKYIQNSVLKGVFLEVSAWGEFPRLCVGLIVAIIFMKKYRMILLQSFLGVNLAAVVGEFILKDIVQRPRPILDNVIIHVSASVYSFPSGHSAQTFALAYILAHYLPKYKAGFFICASMIAFSRLYIQVHYLTDVLGGVILGLLSGWLVVFLFSKISKKVNLPLK